MKKPKRREAVYTLKQIAGSAGTLCVRRLTWPIRTR